MSTLVLPSKAPKAKQKVASEQAKIVPSPVNGVVPPVEHRFKPGQSGNPGGRPRWIREAYEATLSEEVEIELPDPTEAEPKRTKKLKVTRAKLIALNLADCAASMHRNNVAAAKELRDVVEPSELDPKLAAGLSLGISALTSIAQGFKNASSAAAQHEKIANAHEV